MLCVAALIGGLLLLYAHFNTESLHFP